jgi:hypothetical protein
MEVNKMSNNRVSVETAAEALNNPNFSFIETFADASNVEKVRQEMTALLFRARQKRVELKDVEKEKTYKEAVYNKKKREAYIQSANAPNEKHRTILVEIATEKEKYNIDLLENKIKELNRELASIKMELDTWKTITYNLRTEMGSF